VNPVTNGQIKSGRINIMPVPFVKFMTEGFVNGTYNGAFV